MEEELGSLPDGAFSLGCGNPIASAFLKDGEIVLDLGSGSGIDCFLASKRVGEGGRVIGVDMTPEMVNIGRENAIKGDFKNVEFNVGEIENLPLKDNSVDVVVSNCVINLSPNKMRVFEEIYRVLRLGGRLVVSDIVLTAELPPSLKDDLNAYAGCISGALMKEEYLNIIKQAGFKSMNVIEERFLQLKGLRANSSARKLKVLSIKIYGIKLVNE